MIRSSVAFVVILGCVLATGCARPGAESVLRLQFPNVDPHLTEELGFRDAEYFEDSDTILAAGSRLFEHTDYDYTAGKVGDIWKPRRLKIEPAQAPGFYKIGLEIDHSYTPYPDGRTDVETEHEGERYRMERYQGIADLRIREGLWERKNITLHSVELKRIQYEQQKLVLSGTIVAIIK